MTAPSHPPSLTTLVRGTLEREIELGRGAKLVVAVSGGVDSTALLHVLARLRSKLDFELAAITIDHGLRPEAASEVAGVVRLADALDVPVEAHRLDLAPGPNLQNVARDARRALLFARADALFGSGALVATAHHADDRAETLLLRLLRGVSLEGLAVLPPRDERLVRPMIRARRSDVVGHLARHGLVHAEDPSNQDARFLRVRVRSELLPLLENLNPGVVGALERLADEAALLGPAGALQREQRRQIELALRTPARTLDLPLPGGFRLTRAGSRDR